ncbi:UPF0496 protein At1g20180, partial [Linum perenne]
IHSYSFLLKPNPIFSGSLNCQLSPSSKHHHPYIYHKIHSLTHSHYNITNKFNNIHKLICSSTSAVSSDQMTKLSWTKLRSFLFPNGGRSPIEGSGGSLSNKLTVNEEYKEAFRTESYVEMWTELQSKLNDRRTISSSSSSSLLSSSSSSSIPSHLSDYLFRPHQEQETISQLVQRFNCHRILIDYFDSSLDACDLCETLLRSVHSTRAQYGKLKRVIKVAKSVQDSASASVYRDLSSYALHTNPLSSIRPVQFQDIHETNSGLLHELTRKLRKIKRRAKLNRILKRVGGCGLVVIHTTLMATLLVIAIHSLVGIIAAPAVVGCFGFLLSKKPKVLGLDEKSMEKVCSQLDVAAKGIFILVNDLDTISRLATSLSNEVEHRKVLAEMCVRNKNGELLKHVVRELCAYDACYLEQLEELEQHVYLCFHTINRSRRLLMQEMTNEAEGLEA